MNAPFHSATPSTPATSFASSNAEIIEQLKQQLDATTRHLDVTSQQLDTTTRQLNVTSQRLQLSELRVQLLEDKLRLQRIAKYGPGSEKLTNLQLELLELEPGVSNLEVAAEGEREALPPTARQEEAQASWPPDAACGSSARGARDCLHVRTVRVRWLRAVDDGDRLRRERAVGC